MQRKKYLYSNVPIPRTTLYRKRLQEKSVQVKIDLQRDSCTALEAATKKSLFVESPHNDKGNTSSESKKYDEVSSIDHDDNYNHDQSLSDTEGHDELESIEAEEHNEFDNANEAEDEELLQDNTTVLRTEDNIPDFDCADKKPSLNTRLNASTSLTEGDALLMCLALGFRHCLSWVAIVDMLRMINKLFDCQAVKDSKYFIMKYTDVGKDNTVFHLYCPSCERYLGQKPGGVDKSIECPCGWDLMDVNQATTFFLSLGLEEQLRDLLMDPVFVEGLNYRFVRQKINESAFEDIFDGQLYRKHFVPGQLLHEKYNMSYTFNTDGCPVGKASRQTCWPIYIQINELPPHLRSKYMLLAGVYVGPKDPNMKIFLHPFVEEANALSTAGITWTHSGFEINSKVIPLCACLDSVARCKFLNMAQFNGWYGCTLCLHKAEHTESGLRYTLPLKNFEERTHQSILKHAAQAKENMHSTNRKKRIVKGVKGPAPTHNMLYLDLVQGVRPDPMHSMFLGNSRQHTDIMIKSFGKPFYIGSECKSNAITTRLLSIRPPSSITRTPRSLKEVLLWKASEWRSWLLFYGVVCMLGIVPDEFIVHFSMLSSAAHILLQDSISHDQLDKAYNLILRYVYLFQEVFGKNSMVYNVHLLLHVKKSVQYLGPLWTHSAFGFEGQNRYLLQLKKSPSSIAQEIARKYQTFKSLPSLCEKYASCDSAVEFCEQLSGRSLKSFVRFGNILLIGKGRTTTTNAKEKSSLSASGYLHTKEIRLFDRMLYKGVRYTTAAYSRGHKSDDSYIWLQDKSKGQIEKVFQITDENESTCIALFLQKINIKNRPIFNDEFGSMCPIREIAGKAETIIIKPSDIAGQCITMFLENGNFICDVPYGCLGD